MPESGIEPKPSGSLAAPGYGCLTTRPSGLRHRVCFLYLPTSRSNVKMSLEELISTKSIMEKNKTTTQIAYSPSMRSSKQCTRKCLQPHALGSELRLIFVVVSWYCLRDSSRVRPQEMILVEYNPAILKVEIFRCRLLTAHANGGLHYPIDVVGGRNGRCRAKWLGPSRLVKCSGGLHYRIDVVGGRKSHKGAHHTY